MHRTALLSLLASCLPLAASADPAFTAEQFPDLASRPDRTGEFRERIAENDGSLLLEPGVHRITAPLVFDLEQSRSAIIRPASGPVTLIMDGPGPAIRIVGSHEGTAGPATFEPGTWNESMPTVEGIEIVGHHPEADGIELVRCVQPVVRGVAVRWCRHGIRLWKRNRNVVVSDVHLYENSGVGLYLDRVNLHQINVSNSHVSYNRAGGIVVRNGNVRNLHVTGCDLEANMPGDDTPTETANILLDVSGTPGDRSHSIAEVAITGCTIQHSSNYGGSKYDSIAPGGANIRLRGKDVWPIDSVTISGNVLSDTSVLVDIDHATDVAMNGNTFFAPNPDCLHVRDSARVVVDGNTFNPRQFERPGRVVLERCRDSLVTDCTFHALAAEEGAIVVRDCERLRLAGNILTESQSGLRIEESSEIHVKDWIVSGLPDGVSFLDHDEASSVVE